MPGQERIDSIFDMAAVQREVTTLNANLQTVIQTLQKMQQLGAQIGFGNSFSDATRAADEAKAAIAQLRKEREELLNQEKRLKNAAAEAAIQQRANTQSQIDAARVEQANAQAALAQQRLANAQRRQSRNSIDAEAGSLNQLRAFLRQATNAFDAMGEAERNSVRGQALLSYISDLNQQVGALEAATGRHQRNVGNYTESVKKAFGGVKDFFAGFIGGLGIAEIAHKVFETTVELNGLHTALHTVSGSEEEFITNQTYLSKITDRLGLSLTDTTKTFTSFYTAATKSGVAAKQARTIFTDVAEATSTLHLSQEDTNGVLLAFSQILGKGKVQAEELRGQIGERIPGAFKIAADSIGVTQQQLDKMLQKGELIATDFLPKFAQGLKDAFGNDNRVDTLQGSINRLSNAFANMVNDNASGLTRFFQLIVDGFGSVLESANNFLAGFSYVAMKIGDSKLGNEFINNKAIKEYAAQITAVDAAGQKLISTQELLEKSSNIGKNIKIIEHQIEGLNYQIKDLNRNGDLKGLSPDVRKMKDLNKQLEDLEKNLDLAKKTKTTINVEIDARLPQGEDLNARKAVVGPTKAELDAASKAREEEAKAIFEAAKFDLQTRMEADKAIVDDVRKTYFQQLQAATDYLAAKDKLAELEAESDRKQIKERISRGKAQSIELDTVDKKLKHDKAANEIEYSKMVDKIEDQSAADSIKRIKARYLSENETVNDQKNSRLAAVQKGYNDELLVAEDAHNKGKMSDKEYQKYLADSKRDYEYQRVKIANDAAIQEVENEIKAAEEILQVQKGLGIDITAQENELKKLREKLADLRSKDIDSDVKYTIDAEKAKTDAAKAAAAEREALRKKEIEGLKELARSTVDGIKSLFGAYYDSQKAQVEQQLTDLDDLTQSQIDAVNSSTASEQDKADKIAVINAKAAAQKAALQKKEKAVEIEQAKFQKAASAASIIYNTAVAVTKVIPNPILMALAAAAGAVQLATVLATPLPSYRFGTDNHPGGLMMVNDGGQLEPIVSPDGTVSVAQGKNAVVYGEPGTQVFPSFSDFFNEYQGGLLRMLNLPVPNERDGGSQANIDFSGLEKAITNGLVNIQITNTWGGIQTSMKKGANITQFVGKEIKFGA